MGNKLENKIYMAGTYTLQDTGEQVDIALERAMRSTSGLSLAATMGTPAADYPLTVTTALADVNEQYKLYAAEQNRSRWALTITQASNGFFIEVAEAEPVTTSGGVSLEFVSKYNHYRYAVKLTVSDGEVTAVSTRIIADPTLVKETVIDATALDQDKYYPVTMHIMENARATISVVGILGDSGNPSWATHGTNSFSCRALWSVAGSGWGSYNEDRVIDDYQYLWTKDDIAPIGTIWQLGHSSNEYIYVRGGGKYHFYGSGLDSEPVLHTEEFTASGETIWAGISAVRKEESLNKVANDAVKRIRMNATMGAESANWPLSLNTHLVSMQQYYTLFTSYPGQCRWALRVTDAQNAFIEEAELEPVAVSGGIELQFTSKFSKKRYAIVLTLSGGTVTAVKTEYRYRDDQQKYIDMTASYAPDRKAIFDPVSGYWHMNTLTDLTSDQIDAVFLDANIANRPWEAPRPLIYTLSRTNVPINAIRSANMDCDLTYACSQSTLEVLSLSPNGMDISASGFNYFASFGNTAFKKCLDIITDNVAHTAPFTILVGAANALSVKIKGIKRSITMSDSPHFETQAILFWIDNESATSPVTWTFHADLYTRLMADADIQSALQAHPNIALASA